MEATHTEVQPVSEFEPHPLPPKKPPLNAGERIRPPQFPTKRLRRLDNRIVFRRGKLAEYRRLLAPSLPPASARNVQRQIENITADIAALETEARAVLREHKRLLDEYENTRPPVYRGFPHPVVG
jgi:hypothetical protein